jgi:TP901 family phage tail tape measure protein
MAEAQAQILNSLKRIDRETEKTKKRLETMGASAKVGAAGISTSAVVATEKIQGVGKQAERTTKSLDSMAASTFRSAQRWRTFGYLAGMTLTAPLVLAGKSAIDTARNFEYSMQKIQGLAGLPKEEVIKLRKEVLALAPALAQTPQKLAEALYFISSTGWKDSAQAMQILKIAAKGTAAGLGETADVAKLVTYSLNAYKKSGYTAARVADIFTAAVVQGGIEAEGFAEAMQSVLPISSAMGLRLEGVAGAMAATSLQGAKAANAATYLRGMLNSLLKIKPGSIASKALAQLGVTVEDLYRILQEKGGVLKVLIKLQELSKKSTGNIFLKELFRDIRGLTEVLALSGENLEWNQKVIDAVESSYGSLGLAVAATAQTIEIRMRRVKATMDVIKITLGDNISQIVVPALESLVSTLKDFSDWFARADYHTQKFIVHLAGLIAALGPLS